MYSVRYLPIARQDMIDIVGYIARELKNPQAAEKLAEEMIKAIELTRDFPHANPIYHPIRRLGLEYRRIFVGNYTIFYTVDDLKRVVTVSRVLYSKRNFDAQLD